MTTSGMGFNTPRWIGKPLTHITPMSLSDGATFERKLDWVYNYITSTLVPELDGVLDTWFEQYKTDHAALLADIQSAKDGWQQLFDQFMADVVAQLEALNDQAMANLIRNISSETRQALEEILGEKYGITPQSFGAAGDNVTDDTASLQAWINHIANNKLDGYLPPGKYFHSKTLSFPTSSSSWSIKGAGKGRTVIRYNPNDSSTGISGVGISDVELSGFTIDGGFKSHNRLYQGISIKNPMRLRIDDLHIENYGNSAALIFADDVDRHKYGQVVITDSSCDGMGNANNGWNLVNMDDSLLSNVYAFNGGMNTNNTPSCGAQFKNACRNSHMVNVYTYGWKNGLTMGGDNIDVVPMDCSISGADYGSNYGLIIGRGERNTINATSQGARTRAVSFGLNAVGNHVTVNIVNPATSAPPVNMRFHSNTVVVASAYGVTGQIFEVETSVEDCRMIILDEGTRTSNPSTLVRDNSGRSTNKLISLESFKDLTSTGDGATTLYFNGSTRAWVSYSHSGDYFTMRGANDALATISTDELSHGVDNRASSGSSLRRWSQVYAVTGSISTSDEREKRDFDFELSPELRAWEKVQFVKYRWNDAVEAKGDNARIHFGVLAQQVKAAFESEGLDPFKYGILCYDELEGGGRYGVRYDEAMILEAALTRWKLEMLNI